MNPAQFNEALTNATADMMSELYFYEDMPRNRVDNIRNNFKSYLHNPCVSILLNQMIYRLEFLNEKPENLSAYRSMFSKLQNWFENFETERQCLDYFKCTGSFIQPQAVKVPVCQLLCISKNLYKLNT